MIRAHSLIIMLLLFACSGRAQITVSTFAGPNTGIDDALIMDSDGNLYGSHFGNTTAGNGTLYKVDTAGNVSVFSTGFNSCNGLAINGNGELFAVDYMQDEDSNRVYQIDENGTRTPYGPLIYGASGLIADPNSDTLYVSQYASGTGGHRISQLAPDGSVIAYCTDSLLDGPVGMAFDDDDQLYVANFSNAEVYRVTHRGDSLTLLAEIPNTGFLGIGFLTFAAGSIYATGMGVNKVFQISLTGEVTELAGSGLAGFVDGAADTARFHRPNGITTNREHTKLYVSDFTTQSVRVISGFNEPDTATGVATAGAQHPLHLRCFPNPARELLLVESSEPLSSLSLVNMAGQVILHNFLNESKARLDISGLESGTYTLVAEGTSTVHSQRVVIAP